MICDPLPCEISADGKSFPVMTDFRRWILLVSIMDEEKLDFNTKSRLAIKLVLENPSLPSDPSEKSRLILSLMEGIMSFALCGQSSGGGNNGGEQSFDFQFDSELIFASFMQAYGIDLTEVSLHWWKFMALLRNLPPDSPFMRVVGLRLSDPSSIEDDGARRKLRRAKAAVRIRRKNEH